MADSLASVGCALRARLRRALFRRRAENAPLTVKELRAIHWEVAELDLRYSYFQEPLYQDRLEQALDLRADCIDVSQEDHPIAYRDMVAAGATAKTWRHPETEDVVVYVLADLEPQERKSALLRELAGRVAPGYPVHPSRLFDPGDDPAERAWDVLEEGRLCEEKGRTRVPLWFPTRRLNYCGKPPADPRECDVQAVRRAVLTGIVGHYGPQLRLDSADLHFLGLTRGRQADPAVRVRP